MKKSFKRCLSAFLVVVMLCSVFSISVSAATYTITYCPGEGVDGEMYFDSFTTTIRLRSETYFRDHYIQTGWSTTEGGAKRYNFNATYRTRRDITLYPSWSGEMYTLTFLPDEYSNETESTTKTAEYGKNVAVPGGIFTRDGYTQIGWSTVKNGDVVEVALNEVVSVESEARFYPVWGKTYTLTYAPGEYSNETQSTVIEFIGSYENILKGSIFTRDGYFQVGWSTTENSTQTEYDFGDRVVFASDIFLYPVWEKIVHNFENAYDNINLGSVCKGYSTSPQIVLNVTNNSNVEVVYTVPWSENYNISFSSVNAEVGETITVIISPKKYLDVGVYSEQIPIGIGEKESDATVALAFIVRDHIYTEWEETLPATSDSKGIKTRHCQYCSISQSQSIPQLICEAPAAVYASVDEGSITLSWNTSFGADSYNIYKLNDSGEWDYLASTLSGNELMHTDTGNYENNSVYTYAVTAVNEVGETAITDATIDVNYIIHDFSEWQTRKSASCIEDGEEYRVCDTCGAEETKVIQSLGGHSFPEEWETVVELNCTTNGEYRKTCAECGETENKTIVASGHKFDIKWTVDEAETCTEDGKKSRHCRNCNEVTDETVIEATGHDFSLVATLDTHPHGKIYCCNNCGEEKTESAFDPECNECMFVVAQLPNGTLQVNSYIGSDSEVSVPARIGGKVVSSISSDCFRGNKNIVYVEIPDTVTKIPDNAFQNCTYLQFVDTAGSLTSIGDYAFSGCVSLVAVNLYPAVTSIGNGTFDGFRGYILCVRNSFAHQYAVENNLLYDLKDILAKDGSRIDYNEKVIFTNNFACDSIEDIIECFGDVEVIATSRNPAQKYLYGTGSAVSVFDGDEYLGDYVVIVEGDVNGDSVCDVLDMYETMKFSSGKKVPTQEQIYAANGEISDDIDVNSYQNVVNKALS